MEKRIIELYRRKFDDIRHEEDGIEYWYARELMTLLDYVQWRNFENVVKKGMLSCKNNGIRVEDHFAGVSKMVTLGSGANREVEDYMLTRYQQRHIGNELGYDVRRGKKLIRDCLKVGFLIQMDETTFTR